MHIFSFFLFPHRVLKQYGWTGLAGGVTAFLGTFFVLLPMILLFGHMSGFLYFLKFLSRDSSLDSLLLDTFLFFGIMFGSGVLGLALITAGVECYENEGLRIAKLARDEEQK